MLTVADTGLVSTIYSRYEDGAIPIALLPDGKYKAQGKVFPTKRQLLIGLTGHPEARHWTWDRYFRQGKYENQLTTGFPILDMFATGPLSPTSITVAPNTVAPNTPRAKSPSQGIDLQRRGHEVAKLLFAGYGRRIYAMGYEPEDVLQEVYKGLLVRNSGTCAWDPAKSSFGHYVHMVAGCILSNYHRKVSRQRSVEQIGIIGYEDGQAVSMDVADACGKTQFNGGGSSVQVHDPILMRDFITYIKEQSTTKKDQALEATALRILPMVIEGYERGEIAQSLSISKATVSRALVFLRQTIGNWTLSPFMS